MISLLVWLTSSTPVLPITGHWPLYRSSVLGSEVHPWSNELWSVEIGSGGVDITLHRLRNCRGRLFPAGAILMGSFHRKWAVGMDSSWRTFRYSRKQRALSPMACCFWFSRHSQPSHHPDTKNSPFQRHFEMSDSDCYNVHVIKVCWT